MEQKNDVKKPKVLFIYDVKYTEFWQDGLWRALQLLEEDFDIYRWNIAESTQLDEDVQQFDFVLGWSALEGEISYILRRFTKPKGLLIGGYTFEPAYIRVFDVLFYETEWYAEKELSHHPNKIHAFGINADIFKPEPAPKIFDYLTIGAFADWKRQLLICKKEGVRLAVGQVQMNNLSESTTIMSELLINGVGVLSEVSPQVLAKMINASKCVYLPANMEGGSERSVLEARACGVPVEIEDDNEKLKELLICPVFDHNYYAKQIKKGILSCL